MPQPPPSSPRRRIDLTAWRPGRRTLWWILGGIAVGLLMFALVWSGGRDKDDFYRVGEAPPTADTRPYAPLPVPLPAGGEGTRGTLPAPEAPADEPGSRERPQLVETAPPPPPPAPAEPPPATARDATASQPVPIPGRTPAPRYPPRALRQGESGTVLVRAEIGPDGVPGSVSVARSSGSRLLDRAAVDSVLRWRFQPAQVDGRPTVGSVIVPIEFRPN